MIVLFYSNQCQHCNNVIMAIQKSSIQNDIKMFCIDGFQPLPKYITSVPTLKIYKTNTLIVGNDILQWLNSHKKEEVIQDQIAQSSASYTMLNDNSEDINEIDMAYNLRISTPQGQIPSKDGTQKSSGNSFPQPEKMQSGGLDMAYEQLVAERGYGNNVSRI